LGEKTNLCAKLTQAVTLADQTAVKAKAVSQLYQQLMSEIQNLRGADNRPSKRYFVQKINAKISDIEHDLHFT